MPLSAGIIIAIGNVTLVFTENFSLGGIALGSIVAVAGWHIARALAPRHLTRPEDNPTIVVGEPGMYHQDDLPAQRSRGPRT